MKKTAETTLKRVFGYEAFRSDQLECIEALEKGKNTFLIKPTGGGKSLIYQFLAASNNKVVVVSPLIALMEDQVYNAKKYGISSVCLHSQMSSGAREERLKRWEKGEVDLIFMTPERFFKPEFRKRFLKVKADYFVVDEAHCAALWGHDFRPDYSKLKEIRAFLDNPPTMCCTATATKATEAEVIKSVGLDEAPSGDSNGETSEESSGESSSQVKVFRASVLRENLNHEFIECFDFKEKTEQLLKLKLNEGPTLIYFSLIKTLEEVASQFEAMGLNIAKYHSKLPPKMRRSNQEAFIKDEVDFMFATPAFGLGVDKPNIRNLINFELPGSIESYVQEFGRAGRDGKPSKCVLLYTQEDIAQQMDFIKWGSPDANTITWVYRQIEKTKDIGLPENQVFDLKKKMNFFNTYDFRLESSINILLRWGCIEKKGTLFFKGPEPIETVPDVANDLSAKLIMVQQKKLLDLINLVRLESKDEFDFKVESYFKDEVPQDLTSEEVEEDKQDSQ